MLVVTRKSQESIILHTEDGPVEVKILRIRGSEIKLGIAAPSAVRILRSELTDYTEKKT
jgi:carbon storage regulator